MDAKDLNSGLHICQQATLPIKPSSIPAIWMVLFGFGFFVVVVGLVLGFFLFLFFCFVGVSWCHPCHTFYMC